MPNKINIPIKGMHCTACEILTEQKIAEVPGVISVKTSQADGEAVIEYNEQAPDQAKLRQAIREAGYGYGEEDLSLVSKQASDYYEIFQAIIIFLVIYWLLKITGLTELSNNNVGSVLAWPAILMIGLTAGFSSCMALVGGLVLSVTASYAEKHPDLKTIEKFRPHIFFNLGRVVGYVLLGAVLGGIGSAIHLSIGLSGWLIIIIAFVMASLGLKLVGIFPILNRFDIALPKFITKWFNFNNRAEGKYSTIKTMILGALTFFVPCGFTQAMQLYALGSGSMMTGAITMGLFALGTAPGLLGLGGLVSIVKGKWSSLFFRLAGIALIFFALFNLTNGWTLVKTSGFSFPRTENSMTEIKNQESGVNGEQVIRMTQSSRGYSPNKFVVKKGQPVKWIIVSENPNSCSASLVVPKINVNKQLKAGENIIEFTPTEIGQINFSCSMGMYSGVIEVIDNKEQSNVENVPVAKAEVVDKVAPVEKNIVVDNPTVNKQTTVVKEADTPNNIVKVFKTTYTLDQDIQPSEFHTKVGQATRIDVFAKEGGQGCMKNILIQQLAETPQYLAEGATVSLSFTPNTPGRYLIVCSMNIPRGVVVVER